MLRRFRRRGRERDLLCVEFVEVVTDYLEGAMEERDRARLEAHLRMCPHCTRYLQQIRTTIRLTGRLTSDDVDALAPEAREELLAVFRAYRSS
jgi:predicted anti-sigma-YlaC factor YlaD